MDDSQYKYLDEERVKLWRELRKTQERLGLIEDAAKQDVEGIQKGLVHLGLQAAKAYNRMMDRDSESETIMTGLVGKKDQVATLSDEVVKAHDEVVAAGNEVQAVKERVVADASRHDEEVAKLTGMSLDEVKARQVAGMIRDYKLGDARVTIDAQGRAIYQLPEENKTSLSGATGKSFYINWNEPHNRKVVEEYAKIGKTKQDIPLSKLKTVNTSRSTEGSIDWTDTKKTKAAEKAQTDQYTGVYKPSTSVLDALIGFGRK